MWRLWLAALACGVISAYGILTAVHRLQARLHEPRTARRPGCGLRAKVNDVHGAMINLLPPTGQSPPVSQLPPKPFTLAELRAYDGIGAAKQILVALDWRVYDVSSSAHLYGPDGGYHYLAGRDITRNVALPTDAMAVDPLTQLQSWNDYGDLTPEQRDELNRWVGFFQRKYPEVGYLLQEHRDANEGPAEEAGGFYAPHQLPLNTAQLQGRRHRL